MKKSLYSLLVVFCFCTVQITNAQQVSPLQTGHYLTNFSNIRDMATPPPGFFVVVYNYYSLTDSYYDRNGNKINTLPLSQIDPTLPDVPFEADLQAYALAPAFFWAYHKPILGGATYMAGFVPVFNSVNGSFYTELTGDQSGSLNGFADSYFNPVTLSWPWEKFNLTAAYGFTAPTGRYTTGADDNLGLGFWTHQLQSFGYYYPKADQSTAIVLGLTYEHNGKIKDRDFNPGNRFSLEYGISQYLTDKLEVGIQGGHNWQLNDDMGEDVLLDPTIHDRKSSLAFSAGYWVWPSKMQLTFKYGFDYGLVQRFKNDMFMLNLTWITAALTGPTLE